MMEVGELGREDKTYYLQPNTFNFLLLTSKHEYKRIF